MAPKTKSSQRGNNSKAQDKTKANTSSTTNDASSKADVPNWPAFKPLIPHDDLTLDALVPNQILTISNFWPTSLCQTYVTFLRSLPLTTTPGKPKRGDAVRVNDRYQIHDPSFAQRLWSETALAPLVAAASQNDDDNNSGNDNEIGDAARARSVDLWGGQPIGLNPNIRVYRYSKGQFFDQHYDDANAVTFPDGTKATTTWTLLLYLTSAREGCKGGATVFYPEASHWAPRGNSKGARPASKTDLEPVVVELQTGMALLHRHGKECMLHEGREVIEGEKWVLRSDLCVRK